ncbi:MAG: EamA family transporter [Prevotella sp.]|uniref:EamA family transporter n=1 Tax=Prevotella sp. PTAC TaxID=2736295 RepID=UPI0015521D42|nr:EamA family transporter [Prevotella sp. PTAC]MCX4293469.1 EamA family transporter [Prevotella sp.]NPD53373.1 EamA family transporter [Prevotella sp. PTAC]
MNTKVIGYLLGALAEISYGTNPLFALPLYQAGMDPDSVLFFRYLFAIPIIGVMLKVRGRGFAVRRAELPPLVMLGLLVAVSSLTLFESYNYMDVGIASTLLFVYPVIVALIMTLMFKERLTVQTVVSIGGALVGIALLSIGEGGMALSGTGTALVFGSALSYAIYLVAVNRSSIGSMPTLKVTFYMLTFGLSLFVVRLCIGDGLHVPPLGGWYLWANLIALAVFPTAISFLCTTAAIKHIGSTPTAILGALEPATAVFFGMVVFGQQMLPREWCGFVLIILSVSVVVAGGGVTRYLLRMKRLFPRIRRKPCRDE